MTDTPSRWCVLLPCSSDEVWAVPQNCLAEIVTLSTEDDEPPEEITWRGQVLPVLDLKPEDELCWRDDRAGTGLIAVMLGVTGGTWKYCGIVLRGGGLGMKDLSLETIEDMPDLAMETSLSAFRMAGEVYQVPKLQELDARAAVSR